MTVLYILANVAFFAAGKYSTALYVTATVCGLRTKLSRAVPKTDLAAAEQIAASLFFENVFGAAGGANGLNFLIALSAFGNLLAVFLGQSRLLRECGRYVFCFPCKRQEDSSPKYNTRD